MMKFVLLCIVLSFVSTFLMSGASGKYERFEKHVFVHGTDSLPYRLLKPLKQEAGKKYPLVIFLHGSGERGIDNEKQLIHGTALFADSIAAYPCYVVIPQCPQGHKWVEADWSAPVPVQPENISNPLLLTSLLSDSLMSALPIDIDRIYVTGISMGGRGVFDLLYRYPGKFAAAAPVCGSADLKIAPLIKDVPLWAFHGDEDQVVPFSADENLMKAILTAGGTPRFTIYPKLGHNAWDYAYKEPEFLQWLFSHHRKQ